MHDITVTDFVDEIDELYSLCKIDSLQALKNPQTKNEVFIDSNLVSVYGYYGKVVYEIKIIRNNMDEFDQNVDFSEELKEQILDKLTEFSKILEILQSISINYPYSNFMKPEN